MKKIVKLIAINIVVVLGLLLMLNLGAVLIYQSCQEYNRLAGKLSRKAVDHRAGLPNYDSIEWSRTHFAEFSELPTEYRSFVGWRRLPYHGKTINIDSEGIRITPQHPLANNSSPLVVFLGGSTMWGTGVSDDTTIPAFFAAKSGGKYRVLNLGESAYNAFQVFLSLQLAMMQGLRPDIVVSYDGVNERDGLFSDSRVLSHRRENQIRDAMKGKDRTDKSTALSFRQFFLNPLQSFVGIYKEKYSGNEPESEQLKLYDLNYERVKQVARRLLESWLATKRLSSSYDAKFIAVLQPNAGVGNPFLNHLTLPSDQLAALDAYRSLYPEIMRLLHTQEHRQLLDNVVDLTHAFDLDEYIYIDYCHVSPNGNKIIAQELLNKVNEIAGN